MTKKITTTNYRSFFKLNKLFLLIVLITGINSIAESQNSNIGSEYNLKPGLDNDNDGVFDAVDLDDDNDGILDTEECSTFENLGNATSGTGAFFDKFHWVAFTEDFDDGVQVGDSGTTTLSDASIITFTVTNANADAADFTPDDISDYVEARLKKLYDTLAITESLYSRNNGAEIDVTFSFTAITSNGIPFKPIIIFTDPESTDSGETLSATTNGQGWKLIEQDGNPINIVGLNTQSVILEDTNIGLPILISENASSIRIQTTGSDGLQGVIFGFARYPDFDKDEIINCLDLDSDNDGIYDVIEAGNPNVIDANKDGVADGPVDVNGVPVSAAGGTIPIDTDASEFPNYIDIDADNDGIQDNIEGQGTLTYIAPSGTDSDQNGVDDVYDMANNPVTPEDTDGDGTPDYLDLNSDDDCLDDNIEAYDLNQDGVADILPAGADTDNDGLDNNYDTVVLNLANSVTNPSDGNEVPTALPDYNNPGDDVDFRDELISPNPGTDGILVLCNTDTPSDLFDKLGGAPDTGGTWTPVLTSGTGIFDPSIDAAVTYTYTIVSNNVCPDVMANVVVTINNSPNAGINGSVALCETDNPINLFDNLNGTPDAGGTWTPILASGTGIFDPNIDAVGKYTYTIISTAPCPNDTADVLVNVNAAPNAGEDANITLCKDNNPIDLFNSLGGSPDVGGTWTPVLTSGTGIFDPNIDVAVTYSYTIVSNTVCPDVMANVVVTINNLPNAGINGSVALCETDNPINLFDNLNGTPDAGGTWTPILASGTGIFDPNIDAVGKYTYTIISTAPCPNDTADVLVNVNAAPNAGEDANIMLCKENNPIDLFNSLGGSPDVGGTWTPVLTSGTGVFDPAIDTPGDYTYTVNAIAPCAANTATITVAINPLVNAGEDAAFTICTLAMPINLFTSLGGTPNTGGTWTPNLASGTGIFNPSVDTSNTYTYTVPGIAPCADDTAQVIVTIDDGLIVLKPDNLKTCDIDNDTFEVFNLEQQTAFITADNLDYTVTYYISKPDADSGINPLISPYTNIANPQTIYSRVVNTNTGCFDTSINFNIELEQGIIANNDMYKVCDDNMEFDGDITNDSTVFNLTSRNLIVLGPTQAPANFSVSYYLTQDNADNNINPLPDSYQNITNTQTIFARVENTTTFCFETSEVELIVNPMPSFKIDDFYTICIDANGSQVFPLPIIDTGLTVANYSFEWYLEGVLIAGEVTGSLSPIQIGNYNVIVTNNITGCIATSVNTMVIESSPPVLNAKQISLTFVEDNTILATASNGGNVATTLYEFKLDDGQWLFNIPNDNTYTFKDVSAGSHIITARDINGCGETSVTVLVIDYIRYFTPNSDGFNDTWNIIGIENQPDAIIHIFNRFGKLLKQLSPIGMGWDGTYNNEILPTSDYWFSVNYKEPSSDERKKFRAHFTLKR